MSVFGALVLVAIALECQHSNSCSPDGEVVKGLPAFNKFRNNYLMVYSLMMGELSQVPVEKACSALGGGPER